MTDDTAMTELEASIRQQLVEDVHGLLSWLDDEYDQAVPADRQTAEAVVELVLDPRMVIHLNPSEGIDMDEFNEVIRESEFVRLVIARMTINQWAQQFAMPLIPQNVPHGPPQRGGPM